MSKKPSVNVLSVCNTLMSNGCTVIYKFNNPPEVETNIGNGFLVAVIDNKKYRKKLPYFIDESEFKYQIHMVDCNIPKIFHRSEFFFNKKEYYDKKFSCKKEKLLQALIFTDALMNGSRFYVSLLENYLNHMIYD